MHKAFAVAPRHGRFSWAIILLLALFFQSAGVASAAIQYAPATLTYGGYPSQGEYCAALPTNLYRAIPPYTYQTSGYYKGWCCMEATDPYNNVWHCNQQYQVYARQVPVAVYVCPEGYARNAQKPVTDPEACYRVVPDPEPTTDPDQTPGGDEGDNTPPPDAQDPSPPPVPQDLVDPLANTGGNRGDTGSKGGSVDCTSTSGSVGDPINSSNGAKYLAVTDYASAGYSPLRFIRYYDSKMPLGGSLGSHWRHHYERGIDRISATVVKLRRPDGKAFKFTLVDGVWTADGAVNFRLRTVADSGGTVTGWQVVTPADEAEAYSVEGRLQRLVARGGMAQDLAYGDDGRLARVTDSLGRSLVLGYDPQGRLASVTDPAGGNYVYGYDSQGNLASRKAPDNRLLSYLYQNPAFPHALTGIVDGRGRQIDTTFYDSKGRANANYQGIGTGRVDIAYGDDNTSTGIVDAYNTGRSFTYQLIQGVMKTTGLSRSCPTCGTASRSIERDANGNITSKTDYNGIRTTYIYDTARNLETARAEAAGTPVARTVTTEWHATLHVPTGIQEPGRTIDLTYDADGNVTQMQVTDTASGEVRTWAYRYQAYGLLAGSTLPDGTSVSYEYDAQGNLLLARTGGGKETRYSDYDANGRVGVITSANGRTVSLTYDGRGRLLTQSETVAVDPADADVGWWQRLLAWLRSVLGGDVDPVADSATGLAVTRYTYDEAGLLQRIALPDGQTVEYGYDDAQQLLTIADAGGNRLHITRDPMGKPQDVAVNDASGTLVRRLQKDYDALGRLAHVNGANGQALAHAYDDEGHLLSQTNALGEQSRQERDALYRTRATVDPMAARTAIDFNPLDQVVSVTDARGNATSFAPNAFGEVTEEVSPDRGRITRSYQQGRLTQSTDARGITHSFEYDADGRLIRKAGPNSAETYGYDEGAFGAGRRTSLQDESGSTRYTYNSQGRVTTKISTLNDGARLRVQYGYTLGGQLKSVATPGGHLVQYGYDAKGLPTSVTVDGQPLLANLRYGAAGIAGWTWGNGQDRSATSDLDGRLTRLISGNALARTYGYDAADRVVQITDTAAGVTDTYGYDATGRLVRQAGHASVGTIRYQYDGLGNRLSRSVQKGGQQEQTAYQVDPASNRLLAETSGAKSSAYSYLPSGQLSGDGESTYAYNDAGRLTEVRGNRPVRTTYNALGQRVRKVGQGVTLFAYDEAGHLLGEYTPGGVMVREYVWLGSRLVGMLSQQEKGVLYVHADHLGTPRAVSAGATVLWRWEGEAFGNTAPNEQVAGSSRKLRMPLRFPGQYADSETGAFYNYFRDYHPSTGRYIESDPIGLRGGINTFAYANNTPTSEFDQLGLWSITAGGYIGAGGEITVGRDGAGYGFLTVRIGLGWGGGAAYDTNGGVPGPSVPSSPSDGVVLSVSGQAGFAAGPVQGTIERGVGRNYASGESGWYGGLGGSATSGGGIRASASIGGQCTMYSRRPN